MTGLCKAARSRGPDDYAEGLNVWSLLREPHPVLHVVSQTVLDDFHTRWIKPNRSFHSRERLAGWDNVRMPRWAHAPMFPSLVLMSRQFMSAGPARARVTSTVPVVH